MDLRLSPEHEVFRDDVTDFLIANKAQWPQSGLGMQDPKRLAWQTLLIDNGYAARTIAKEYGGHGAEPDILRSRLIRLNSSH